MRISKTLKKTGWTEDEIHKRLDSIIEEEIVDVTVIIDKKGLKFSYNLSVTLITISSLLLAFTSKQWLIPFISSSLFGASYIFLTGVLLVWGIKIFLKNASIGIGLPFLLLSLGQVIGSLIAGILIDIFEFETTFLIFSVISFLAIFTSPTFSKKSMNTQSNYNT